MRGRRRGSVPPKATPPGIPGQGHGVWPLALCQSDAGAIATVPTASRGLHWVGSRQESKGSGSRRDWAHPGRAHPPSGLWLQPRPLFGPCPKTGARSESSRSVLTCGTWLHAAVTQARSRPGLRTHRGSPVRQGVSGDMS